MYPARDRASVPKFDQTLSLIRNRNIKPDVAQRINLKDSRICGPQALVGGSWRAP
jgi:hypothetical protein